MLLIAFLDEMVALGKVYDQDPETPLTLNDKKVKVF